MAVQAQEWNTALAGGIFTAADAVTNEAANKVADYEGPASLALSMTFSEAYGQNLFRQASCLTRVAGSMNVGTVDFAGATIGTLLGLTAATGTTLEAAGVTATVWELDNTLSTVTAQEWLLEVLRSGDDMLFQTWMAEAQIGGDMPISFTHGENMAHDISLILSTDSDGKFIKFLKGRVAVG